MLDHQAQKGLKSKKPYLSVRENIRLGQMFDDRQDVVAGALDAPGWNPVLRVVLEKN